MGSLITFPNKAKSIKLDTIINEKYQDLVSNLRSNPASNPEELADTILKIGNHFYIQAPPLIVNITQDFGFFSILTTKYES